MAVLHIRQPENEAKEVARLFEGQAMAMQELHRPPNPSLSKKQKDQKGRGIACRAAFLLQRGTNASFCVGEHGNESEAGRPCSGHASRAQMHRQPPEMADTEECSHNDKREAGDATSTERETGSGDQTRKKTRDHIFMSY